MTDLERFFRALVRQVADADPVRLHGAIHLAEVSGSFFPYRVARRVLGLGSHEDYEALLLRLAAGEGALVRTAPDAARQAFAAEAASPNPDLGVLHRFPEAALTPAGEPLAYALGPEPEERRYAPPAGVVGVDELEEPAAESGLEFIEPGPDEPEEAMADLTLPLDEVRLPPPPPIAAAGPAAEPDHCAYCGGTLPTLPAGRRVLFCPHCGQSRGTTRCPECRSEVELGWRHCVACGAAVN